MLKLRHSQTVGKTKIGLSLASAGFDAKTIGECLDTPGIDAAELPFESAADFRQRHPNFLFHSGRVIDKTLSQNILAEPPNMRAAFVKQLSRLLERAADRGFSSVSLDLGLETALDDDLQRKLALETLRSLYPVLLERRLTLSLPCRIPSLTQEGHPAMLADFIKDCLMTGLKATLEIHPYELPVDFDPKKLVRGLEFDLSSVVLMYSADIGKLSANQVKPWMSFLGSYGFHGPFFLCPKSGDRSRLSVECLALSKLIAALKKE